MSTVTAGQSVQLQIGAFEGLWVNCSGVGFIDFECKSRGTIQLTPQYQRIGYYGDSVCVELRCVSGVIDYSTTPVAIEPLTAKQAGDGSDSSPLDLKLTVNQLVAGASQQQTVVLYGDSYSDAQQSQNELFVGECLSISVWRFVFGLYGSSLKIVGNASMAGSDSAELLSRLPQVQDIPSDWVFMNIGANDFYNASFTAETVFNNMTAAIAPLIAEGRKVLLLASFPQLASRANFSAAKSLESQKYNRMMADWCAGRNGVFFVDTFKNSVDWADTTNAAGLNKDFITDGIHVSVTCGIEVANECAKFLDAFVPRNTSLYFGPTLPTVIGVTKSVLAGTSGTNGTGSSGSVATSFTSSRSAGTNGTVVASKITPVGQRLTITLTAANGLSTFRFFTGANSALGAVTGQRVATRTSMRFRTVSGSAFLRQVSTRLYASDGVTNFNQYNGRVQGSFPTSAMTTWDTGNIVLDTYPLLIPSTVTGSSGYYFEIELDSTAGGVVEVDFYGIDVFVVPV